MPHNPTPEFAIVPIRTRPTHRSWMMCSGEHDGWPEGALGLNIGLLYLPANDARLEDVVDTVCRGLLLDRITTAGVAGFAFGVGGSAAERMFCSNPCGAR